MSQTSKLLRVFLSPPPPRGMGLLNKVYRGRLRPEVQPLTLLHTKPPRMRNYRDYPPGLNPSLGARDVLCAVSGFGLQLTPSPLHALKIR